MLTHKKLATTLHCPKSALVLLYCDPRHLPAFFAPWLLAVLFFLSFHHPAFPQTVPLDFTRTLWRGQDGLPESIVQAAAQTRDGYLWIGTTGGLARFDGSQFVSFPLWRAPAAPIPVNSVFSLLPAADGSLWVGTEGGGLLHFSQGQIHSYSARQGLTDSFIRSILEDGQGRIWIGSDNGLFRLDPRQAQSQLQTGQPPSPIRLDNVPQVKSLAVHAIAEDHLHRIWVGGSSLLMFDSTGVHIVSLAGLDSQNRVKTITETADGTLWVGTVGGLQRLDHGHFSPIPVLRGITVRTLHQTRDRTLWIGTIGHGLWTYRNSRFAPLASSTLLPSNTVLSLSEDADGQLWIGTQDGLVRLSRTPVSVVPLPGGSDPDFETISCDPDGSLWVAGSSVYRIRDSVARLYSFAALPGLPIRNVFRGQAGELWVGTDGSGAWRLGPPTHPSLTHYHAPGELTNNFVRAFLQTSRGDIWIATDEGVNRIGPHGPVKYGVTDGLAYFSTRSLLEDRTHDIWIGTDQGLSHWRSGAFVHDEATEALAQEKVWSIRQDHAGTLWFGTRDHGLFGFYHNRVTQLTTAQNLPSNSIYQILEDRSGLLWFSGPSGVYAVSASELDKRANPPANGPSIHPEHLNSADAEPLNVVIPALPFGADGAQMYGGRQPSGCVDTAGRVWFPSSKGAVHVAAGTSGLILPPPVILGSPRIDGQPADPTRGLRLPARAFRVELPFTSLLLRPQESVDFRYKLEGFDSRWTIAGRTRLATYTNLPSGAYRFRVVAFLPDDPARTSEATLSFEKQPYLYQTRWFVALCATLLATAAFGIYQLRMHQIRSRFEAVLAERSRLAREMHDTVIQGCTSVSALLEAIASVQMVDHPLSDPSSSDDLLNYARTQIRSTIDEAREAVWNLRHGNERTHDLSASLDTIAAQMTREFNLSVTSIVEGTAFPLRDSVAHELLMVVRESLYNAALHGRPATISIRTRYGRQWLELHLEDDGVGFDPASVTGNAAGTHYGITGMRERVARLGGRFTITSTPGRGTRVQIAVRRAVLAAGRRGGKA